MRVRRVLTEEEAAMSRQQWLLLWSCCKVNKLHWNEIQLMVQHAAFQLFKCSGWALHWVDGVIDPKVLWKSTCPSVHSSVARLQRLTKFRSHFQKAGFESSYKTNWKKNIQARDFDAVLTGLILFGLCLSVSPVVCQDIACSGPGWRITHRAARLLAAAAASA